MKEKIKSLTKTFIQNGRGALILLFVLELVLAFFITPNLYDDKWFMEQITNEVNPETNEVIEHTIPDFVKNRYENWSSRVIIEFTLCLVLRTSKYLWILLECLMVTLACYSISRIFVKDDKNRNNLMLVCMILIYPYITMYQTGWASTSINYMWPLATMLFALIPIAKVWRGEKIKWFQYILYTLSLIFAANHEQACALLVGFYGVFFVLHIARNKKFNFYMFLMLALSIASMVFILTCPGNHVRQVEEAYRLCDYEMFSTIDKFVLGFTSTFGKLIEKQDLTYIMCTALIATFVYTNYKDKLYRVVAIIPICSVLIFGMLLPVLSPVFPNLQIFKNLLVKEDVLLNVGNCNNLYYTFPMLFAFANFIAICMSLLLIFGKIKNNLPLLIFVAGFATRIVVAFSPTVFVSKTRTMIFLDFAMIIISYLIWNKMGKKEENKKVFNITTTVIEFAAVIQFIDTLIYIYSKQLLY